MYDGATEILVTTLEGEVIASISETEIIQQEDVLVRINYGSAKDYEDIDGKVYVVD